MSENISFTERAIIRAQRLSVESTFALALTGYFIRLGRMAYDFERRCWWVKHPSDGWQVAVWMMPACEPIVAEAA